MTESLNAGNELDDELPIPELDAIEADYDKAEAALSMDEDVAALESIANRASDLEYLMEDIQKAHGMSQSFAMEAERILPGFSDLAPIGYYTRTISATRLKVSMEELSKGMWALIAAAAAAVIGLIVKIVSWLSGKKKSDGGGSSSDAKEVAKERVAEMERVSGVAERVGDALKDVNPREVEIVDEKGKSDRPHTLTDLFEMLNENYDHTGEHLEFFSKPNPLYYDLVNGGEYSKAIDKMNNVVEMILAKTGARLDLAANIYADERANFGDANARLRIVQKLQSLTVPQPFNFQGITSLSDYNHHISGLRKNAESASTGRGFTVEKVMETLERVTGDVRIHNSITASARATATLLEAKAFLADMENDLKKVQNDNMSGEASADVAKSLRAVVYQLGHDISNLGMLLAHVDAYTNTVRAFSNSTQSMIVKTISYYKRLIDKNGVEAAPQMKKFIDIWEKETKDTKGGMFSKTLGFVMGKRHN